MSVLIKFYYFCTSLCFRINFMRTIQFREAICEAMSEEMRQAVREYLGWHLLVKATKI